MQNGVIAVKKTVTNLLPRQPLQHHPPARTSRFRLQTYHIHPGTQPRPGIRPSVPDQGVRARNSGEAIHSAHSTNTTRFATTPFAERTLTV